MSQFNHDRPLLDVSTCEHGKKLTIVGVYVGDSFCDPGCRTQDGKMRLHTAKAEKYAVAREWIADKERTEELRKRAAHMRSVGA